MAISKYNIPDISNSSKYTKPYNIDNNIYTFEFQNNFRDESINLSILKTNESNENEYIVRNIRLVTGINLTSTLLEDDFVGRLYLYDLTGNFNRPTFDNISTNYAFLYDDLQD